MLICLNKLIFHWVARLLNSDFFWVQFGTAASGAPAMPIFPCSSIWRFCELFHDVLMNAW